MAGFIVVLSLLGTFSMAAAINPLVHAAGRNPPAIFSFGDSLSDVGNNNALSKDAFHADQPPYGVDFPGGVPTGRVTNGYNLIDILAQHMGFQQSPPAFDNTSDNADKFTGVNFASGGSGLVWECMNGTTQMCYTMDEQIEQFKVIRQRLQECIGDEAAEELINDSIFTFTCGSNDIFYLYQTDKEHFDEHIDGLIKNMSSAFRKRLMELYTLGGRKFAIANVPALGMIPVLLNLGLKDKFNNVSKNFNSLEEAMVNEVSSTLAGMRYSIGNAHNAIVDAVEQPNAHGMNVTAPCCGSIFELGCDPDSSLCEDRSKFAFFDWGHPTQVVIEYAAGLFYDGNLTFASPINLKQLVENGRGSGGSIEAT